MNRKIAIFSIITIVGVIIDQVTKYIVRASEAINAPGGVPVIDHFFSLVHAENPGAALGMLGNIDETWRVLIFVGFTIVAAVIVWDLFRRLPPTDIFLSTTLGLILSGAIGNVIDRVFKPIWGDKATVTDFLHFYTDDPGTVEMIKGWFSEGTLLYQLFGDMFANAGSSIAYPTFNVADINLVVGVGLFLIHYLFIESRKTDDAEGDEDGADLEGDEDEDEDLDEEGEEEEAEATPA